MGPLSMDAKSIKVTRPSRSLAEMSIDGDYALQQHKLKGHRFAGMWLRAHLLNDVTAACVTSRNGGSESRKREPSSPQQPVLGRPWMREGVFSV
ncbi:hypothetical protein CEXT_465981 [Caerostris extrusa]|uniref:Uncharacterized protein n=1 Tax=Caerostris extrusa TaxID=172846 RepID=A0AAV4XTX7_CAEEX|nr:hypothetical protein CEXT_465981 [Caerostris extrusa]